MLLNHLNYNPAFFTVESITDNIVIEIKNLSDFEHDSYRFTGKNKQYSNYKELLDEYEKKHNEFGSSFELVEPVLFAENDNGEIRESYMVISPK
ncbi:hypothetical protein [uncultured Pontibacter sp.]|uniref:hypothetical protein n=1 Tax=uncultured Pontibacter sp. TaxID=453356 RepID=UPI0026248FEE|nr:hypothetical protein [uncultured Pontibacter sp.]